MSSKTHNRTIKTLLATDLLHDAARFNREAVDWTTPENMGRRLELLERLVNHVIPLETKDNVVLHPIRWATYRLLVDAYPEEELQSLIDSAIGQVLQAVESGR